MNSQDNLAAETLAQSRLATETKASQKADHHYKHQQAPTNLAELFLAAMLHPWLDV